MSAAMLGWFDSPGHVGSFYTNVLDRSIANQAFQFVCLVLGIEPKAASHLLLTKLASESVI